MTKTEYDKWVTEYEAARASIKRSATKRVSYWQRGCDDAKAGKPADPGFSLDSGYVNGFRYGQGFPKELYEVVDATGWLDDSLHGKSLAFENPYMALISKVEEVLEKVSDPTNGIDRVRRDAYSLNLLEVRDALHRFQQEEAMDTICRFRQEGVGGG